MKSIDAVAFLVSSVKESLARYEAAAKKLEYRRAPSTGYEVDREDSKESIQRRIAVIREELLKISKSL